VDGLVLLRGTGALTEHPVDASAVDVCAAMCGLDGKGVSVSSDEGDCLAAVLDIDWWDSCVLRLPWKMEWVI
jgi:hypothetical protein